MLSKLSSQIINQGFRFAVRASSTAAQQKLVVERKPEVKYHKVQSNTNFK